MYVGYMYGASGSITNNRTNTGSSPIKKVVDNWYKSGLNIKVDVSGNKYDSYISQTAIYCNDRAYKGTYSLSSKFDYIAKYRLVDNKTPSYKCGSNADKFSKNTSKGGNGQLQYPIALMTADEISFAGGLYATNTQAWYYYNSGTNSITGSVNWWTMSPFNFSLERASVFNAVGSTGRLSGDSVNIKGSVRPVISLKSCITWKSGNGSSSTPYEVEIDSTCASAVN